MTTRHLRYLALAGSVAAVAGILAGCGRAHPGGTGAGAGASAQARAGGIASPAPTVGLAPAPARLSDRIALSRTSVSAGTPIKGALIVTNRGRTAVNLTRYCRPYFAVRLTGHGLPVAAAFPATCSNTPFLIKPGVTRLPVTVFTTYSGCTSRRHATAHTPACLSGGRMPPLPAGRYQAVLVGSGDLPLPPAEPVKVILTSP
jgi:hypothetical protein